MHVQLAERRIAVENLERRMLVEMPLELFGRAVLDRVAARLAREQTWEGEVGEDDGHDGCGTVAPGAALANNRSES